MRIRSVALVLIVVAAACGNDDEAGEPTSTTAATSSTTTSSTTSTPSTTTTSPTTTTTTSPGPTITDVEAGIQQQLDADWNAVDPKPDGVTGPPLVTCEGGGTAPFGTALACHIEPQTEPGTVGETGGLIAVVIDDVGTVRWVDGSDLPDNDGALAAAHTGVGAGLFCRDLEADGYHPFDYSYTAAIAYWFLEGRPDRMDADTDGVPCETVYPFDEVATFWEGTAYASSVEAPATEQAFGFITTASATELVIDYAEMLWGEEADKAAVAAGELEPGEHVDNDYYIRNVNPRLRTYPIAAGTSVLLQACFVDGDCVTLEPVDTTTWAALVAEAQRCHAEGWPEGCEVGGEGWSWYGSGFLPYWITIEDGVVTTIEEQYLP